MKITFTKPTRAWPYIVLACLVINDFSLAMVVPKGCLWAQVMFTSAIVFAKLTMGGFIFDYGFRTSIEAWRAKCKREEDRAHARFMRAMDDADARNREFIAWWNREHNAGEEWKNGGET